MISILIDRVLEPLAQFGGAVARQDECEFAKSGMRNPKADVFRVVDKNAVNSPARINTGFGNFLRKFRHSALSCLILILTYSGVAAREKATLAWVIYDRANAEVHRIIYPDFTYQDFASTLLPSESVIFVEMKALGFPPDVYKATLAVRKSLLW